MSPEKKKRGGKSILQQLAEMQFKGLITPAILVIVGIILGGAVLNGFFNNLLSSIFPQPATGTVSSTRTILLGIQPMGQLVSVSTQLAKANINVGIQQHGVLNNNLCGFAASYVAQGTIRAGIDLSQIAETDVTYDAETGIYTLSVPSAQVTSCSVDYIDQYAGSTTLCPGTDWDEARQLASYTALSSFRDDALEGGIQKRAEQQATVVLSSLVKALTGKEVQIVYKPAASDSSTIDPTCQPEAPLDWQYDTTSKSWSKTS